MIPSIMADFIRSSMSFPLPVSTQLLGWSTAIINELQTFGKVNNASGTITGTVPPSGGPLVNGAGSNGLISMLQATRLASAVVSSAGYPFTSTQVSQVCVEIVSHIQTLGTVSFATGNIQGVCTNSPITPGTLSGGTGVNGTISGLDGTILANAIHTSVGYPGMTSIKLIQFCTAIVSYIMANADVSYSLVTGTCSAGGGSLIVGSASNGTIL